MGAESEDLHELADERIRSAGLVYTKGRRELVDLLASFEHPATMTELRDLRPRLNQSSLYRNMTDLENARVVQKVIGTDDTTRYELAEELIGHHHHTICSTCGAVADFVVPARFERSLETALTNALAESGFEATGHRLDVVGVCAACR
jgi:Fe2+ or Zn2+ uptake regulation protein